MIVRKLRLQRGWSQDQLAHMSGLNVRTVQRIERGHAASLESLKSLAAVFETDVTDLQPEDAMNDTNNPNQLSYEEHQAMEYVRELKGFYLHLMSFVIVIPILYGLNLYISDYMWVWWVIFGWGLGLLLHGVGLMEWGNLFGPDWERRQIEKRLGRKL